MLLPGADGVPHFWPPSPMGYPIFGRFLDPIWCQLGAILGHFGARAGPGWAGGVTRSAKNFLKSGDQRLEIAFELEFAEFASAFAFASASAFTTASASRVTGQKARLAEFLDSQPDSWITG